MKNRRCEACGRVLLTSVGTVTAACLLVGFGGYSAAGGGLVAVASVIPDAGSVVVAPSPDEIETLEEGETLPVELPANEVLDVPASSAEVTLTALKQADVLEQGEYLSPETADPETTYVCLEFKVKNTGDAEFDTSHLTEARWVGKDGETENVDQAIGADCAELGLEKNNLLTEPDPRPGEFVRATTVLMVPDTQPGVLEFADGLDRPLFEVEVSASR